MLPRVVLFVHTLRVDTMVSRRSFYIANFVCTGIWIALFVIKVILILVNNTSKQVTWLDVTIFLMLLTLQVYFAAVSRSYWIDYELHRSKVVGYYETRPDRQITLNDSLFGVT